MQYSKNGLALTESFEANGPVLTAYADPLAHGKPTVGWGHTGPDVVVGAVWTREQCEEALRSDIHWLLTTLAAHLVHLSVTQGRI
jgi:lysozyme